MRHIIFGLAAFLAVAAQGAAHAQAQQAILTGSPANARTAPSDSEGFIPPMRGTPEGRISGGTRGMPGGTLAAPVDDQPAKPSGSRLHPRSIIAKPAETVQH